ncbi:uncharacterized protein LOC112568396 [Pomacea canaliculata]|uniref:uncharacterized protein LOC112568396 n=1 Tax=Pomacea canaliculata TaxID=400727 RepID=UPI000D729180|nr:uncharacterized protein LOC112568396 [Pomacea canaliculata]
MAKLVDLYHLHSKPLSCAASEVPKKKKIRMKIQEYFFLIGFLSFDCENGTRIIFACTVTDKEAPHENITIQDNTQADFIYHLRVNTSQTFNDTIFVIETKLCEIEKYHDVCRCRWIPGKNAECRKHRDVFMCEADNHVMRFSLLVRRTYSHILWELYRPNLALVMLKTSNLQVIYPPKVTGLQVNGRETNETFVVDENQMLRVSCTFENGNPPVSFLIRDKTRQRHNSTKQEGGPLVISLEGSHCHDIWPVITCEAPGSELNRSVAILVRCLPELFHTGYHLLALDRVLQEGLTFRMRSYTTNIKKCMMTKFPPQPIIKQVPCALKGRVPELRLFLSPAMVSWTDEGIWMLHVFTEMGDSNITFVLTNTTTDSRGGDTAVTDGNITIKTCEFNF